MLGLTPTQPSIAAGVGSEVSTWHVAHLKRGVFGHLLAFGCIGPHLWVVVDPCRHRTSVRLLIAEEFDRWIAVTAPQCDILRLDHYNEDIPLVVSGGWCVGAVRRLVGIRSSALTPAGLMRDLRRAGAQKAFPA